MIPAWCEVILWTRSRMPIPPFSSADRFLSQLWERRVKLGRRVTAGTLRACETRSQCVFLAPPRAPLKPSLLHSIVFHMLLISRERCCCMSVAGMPNFGVKLLHATALLCTIFLVHKFIMHTSFCAQLYCAQTNCAHCCCEHVNI